ncbi:hypothetical protein OGAPHI_006493 [Ogataea philodendri]|uniref:Uncharacterized protein n=1 Tax=Ogataea philodendri TaxID=1378263 RepID=A0A9P8NWM8_9ASCO|nr:uncharacterized protein OGAPHI_006493 [Ogataea philodendri]KAH3661643.1 hypothetical protein OGAPHI_006493 [Ogataea philodendri]
MCHSIVVRGIVSFWGQRTSGDERDIFCLLEVKQTNRGFNGFLVQRPLRGENVQYFMVRDLEIRVVSREHFGHVAELELANSVVIEIKHGYFLDMVHLFRQTTKRPDLVPGFVHEMVESAHERASVPFVGGKLVAIQIIHGFLLDHHVVASTDVNLGSVP